MPPRADAAQQLESVGVIDDDLILLGIHNIEKAIFVVESQADRIDQALGDLALDFVLGVEDRGRGAALPSETKSRSSSSMARPLIQPKWAS